MCLILTELKDDSITKVTRTLSKILQTFFQSSPDFRCALICGSRGNKCSYGCLYIHPSPYNNQYTWTQHVFNTLKNPIMQIPYWTCKHNWSSHREGGKQVLQNMPHRKVPHRHVCSYSSSAVSVTGIKGGLQTIQFSSTCFTMFSLTKAPPVTRNSPT